ncbi:MAG: hypothetical protein HYX26_09530 [Acidobacteriales bacterium]|nr:hypothetical protein [Terriglobales bacterium]
MRSHRLFLIASLFLTCVCAAQTPKSGVVHPKIECADDPAQSYALYLPSNYDPKRPWPIIYAFDPIARGSVPVERLKAAAEESGYIVAGSNNARNFSGNGSAVAAQAVWKDTHQRLAIDPAQVYVTGLSGGSRTAAMIAVACDGCIQGVIGVGAGFSSARPPKKGLRFVYYGLAGELDFNYVEMVALQRKLSELGVPNHLRVFSGGHQWPPVEEFKTALVWLNLQAMKQGRRAVDNGYVSTQLQQAMARADAQVAAGNLYEAYRELRQIPDDFKGLADAAEASARAGELQRRNEVKEGKRWEEKAIALQDETSDALAGELQQFRTDPAERLTALARLRSRFTELKRRVAPAAEKESAESRIYRRTLSQAEAQTEEAAEAAMWDKDFESALTLFDVVFDVDPQSGLALLNKARALSLMGKKDKAIAVLRLGREKGLIGARVMDNTPEFKSLQDSEDYRKLLIEPLPKSGTP